jgi:hypothetical protein
MGRNEAIKEKVAGSSTVQRKHGDFERVFSAKFAGKS